MKPLLSIVTLLVGLGAVIGGTFAVFTDTETTSGSTFTAGTVDIAVDGQNPWASSYQVSVGEQTGGLKPSQTGYITFDIGNVGDNPVHVWKMVSNVRDGGGLTAYDCRTLIPAVPVSSEPECQAETALAGTVTNISTKIIYDLSILPPGPSPTPVVLIADTGVLGELEITDYSLADRVGLWIYLGVINPADTMVVTQSYHLVTSAGNEYQGDTSTFDIDLFASQVEGAAIDPCGDPLSTLSPPVPGDQMACV
ncbi:MAG: TasA family protein [Chloroflexota bacterium]|nr:TasA family protein [Chloroflexota bacterium]